MAFQKKIASKGMGVVQQSEHEDPFPVGTKFMYDGAEYRVISSFEEDNTQMKKCTSTTGTQEIIPLFSLLKDVRAKQITFLKDKK